MKFKHLLIFPLLVATLQAASVADLTFTLNSDSTEYSVSDCDESASGSLDIPSTYNGLHVTLISSGAFADCSNLTSITIPDSVTSIGGGAFRDCSSLTSITIGDSVTSIGLRAFDNTGISFSEDTNSIKYLISASGNTAYLIDGPSASGNVVLPNTLSGASVTLIGEDAFADCSGLTSITIPDSVTSIGDGAFYRCTSLTSITIPDGVTSIEAGAFLECTSLTSVTIGDGVTSISDFTFERCPSLRSVTIGDSVTSIGDRAFYGCGIAYISIPDSVTSIGDDAFYPGVNMYCHGDAPTMGSNVVPYNALYYNPDKSGWSDIVSYLAGSICTLTLNRDGTGYKVFDVPDEVAGSLDIPSTYNGLPVTSIGNEALLFITRMTSVTIPDSVTLIERNAFNGCSNLTSVTIGDSVTSIGNAAFRNCTSLTSITIPDSVTSIGDRAFYGCTNLTSSITIPDSVTSIGSGVFGYCTSLTSIDVSSANASFSSIGGVLFNKIGTTLISYPPGKSGAYSVSNIVTSIESYAFDSCTNLTSITIPDSVTSIGDRAFFRCTSLSSITIPDSVTSIGSSVFAYCWSLTSIDVSSANASFSSIGGVLFNKIGTTLISYLGGKSGAYSVSNIVTSIESDAFAGCNNLTSITIPDSVTSIGESAFSGCTSLTSITIPDSLTSIERNVFEHCTGLTSIIIADSVTSIGDYAFDGCTSLISIRFDGEAPHYGIRVFSYTQASEIIVEGANIASYGGYGSTFGGLLVASFSHSDYDALVTERDARLTMEEVRDARFGSTIIEVSGGKADITMILEETSDLNDWSNPTTSEKTIQADAPSGTRFYRFKMTE